MTVPHVGVLGDVHGDFAAARRIMTLHPEVLFWLCVGDVADSEGRYEDLPSPLYWIKGNNENFDAIAAGALPANLHYLPNGQALTLGGLRVAGLGGTFAPTFHDVPAAALPHPARGTPRATALADKRRHFVREEVDACRALRGVDVLLTHEAPRPYRVNGREAGQPAINEILDAMQPRLHLFGHHHRFSETTREGVTSIGLDLVSRSYLLVEPGTLAYHLKS